MAKKRFIHNRRTFLYNACADWLDQFEKIVGPGNMTKTLDMLIRHYNEHNECYQFRGNGIDGVYFEYDPEQEKLTIDRT